MNDDRCNAFGKMGILLEVHTVASFIGAGG